MHQAHRAEEPERGRSRRPGAADRRAHSLIGLQRSAGNRAVGEFLRGGPPPLLVDAGVTPEPAQLAVAEFLDALEQQVKDATDEILGALDHQTRACPYIDFWLAHYRQRTADQVERALRLYLEGPDVTTARDYLPHVVDRVRLGVSRWKATGEVGDVPPGVPLDLPVGTPNAPAVQRDVGPGRPVDARMGAALGFDVSRAVLHDGPAAARSAADLGAHAYTVGRHVVLGGTYRPGTLEGDAVLAHELAHAAQQDDTAGPGQDTAGPGQDAAGRARDARDDTAQREPDGPADAPVEADADRSALGAVLRLYGRTKDALAVVGERTGPALRSGLRVRRCGADHRPESPRRVTGDEAARFLAGQAEVTTSPSVDRPVVGTVVTFGLSTNTMPPLRPRRWYVYPPGVDSTRPRYPDGAARVLPVTFTEVGTWTVDTEVYLPADNVVAVVSTTMEVAEPAAVLGDAFAGARSADYTRIRAGMALHELELAQHAQQDQSAGGGPHISTTTANPLMSRRRLPDVDVATYTLTPNPAARAFHWYVTAEGYDWDTAPRNARDGNQRITVRGQDAYDLGTNPNSARFSLYEAAVWTINCDQLDGQGALLGTVRYRHAVQTAEQAERLTRWRRFQDRADREMRGIQAGRAQGVRAVHLSTTSARTTELALFVGPDAADPRRTKLVDITPGTPRSDYGGDSVVAAIADFESGNSYPEGSIRLEAPGVPARTLHTTGASDLAAASGGFGWASLGLAGAGVLLAATGVGLAAVPYLFLAAAAAGAVSSGLSLADRLRQAEPDATGVALDVVGIASSLIGAAQAVHALRAGGEVLSLATRTGRYLRYTGFATDTVQGVLLTVESVGQIDQVLGSNLPQDQKINAIVRILGMLTLNGGMLAYGARRMRDASTRLEAALGRGRIRGLNSDAVHHLNALDDASLARLRTATPDQLDAVARLVAEDPSRAAVLSRRHGGAFTDTALERPGRTLAEVSAVLEARVALSAGGTRSAGVYTPLSRDRWGPQTLPPMIDTVFGAAGTHRVRALGATLHPAPPGSTHPYVLVVPAASGRPEVRVLVRFTAVSGPSPSAPHGAAQGPAEFVLARTDTGWSAEISVDKRLRDNDFPFPVGHELDEIALTVRDSRVSPGWRSAHAQPALYRPGPGRAVVPTPHDRAAARELVALWDFAHPSRPGQLPPSGEGSLRSRLDRVDRLMEAMGFGENTNLEEKLYHLRAAGAPDDLVRAARVRAELQTHLRNPDLAALRGAGQPLAGGVTAFDADNVEHMLLPRDPFNAADFLASGIRGGHHDPLLRGFLQGHPSIYLVHESQVVVAGCTYRKYYQYRWKGNGPMPSAGDPRLPQPGGVHDPALWDQAVKDGAPLPKTTFSDPTVFMAEADAGFAQWRQTYPALASGGTNRFGFDGRPPAISPSGVHVGGFFTFTAGTGSAPGTWRFRTVFVDGSWL